MRIAVVGAGSVGMLMTARLALAGCPVVLVTRSGEQAERVRREGLTLKQLDGRERTVRVEAVAYETEWPEADLFLLAVKQPDLPPLLPFLRALPTASRVIAMQNGMGHRELLLDAVPMQRLFFAVNSEGARRLSPAAVEHTGQGTLRVGPWHPGEAPDDMVRRFVERASAAAIPAEWVDGVAPLAWRKLLANACINPLTALWEVQNGELLKSREALLLMRRVFDEAAEVARRDAQKIGEADWKEILSICRNTSRNHSSMLQDLWNGKPTEIESINGYIARKGREHGLSVPTNETLRRAVLLKTSLRQGKGRGI